MSGNINAPGAPSFAKAVAGNESVTVSWGKAPEGTYATVHYVVRIVKVSGNTQVGSLHVVSAATFSTKITGLINGTHYYAQVWARMSDPDLGPVDGVGANTTTFTPTSVTVPGAPGHPAATAGDTKALVSWTKPTTNGGSAVTGYVVKAYIAANDKFVKQVTAPATAATATVTGLTDLVTYYFNITATNTAGSSAPAKTPNVIPGASTTSGQPSVTITITSVTPDKIPNRRAGQSAQDAPQVAVAGTNLDQLWGVELNTRLTWVLYRDTTWTTVIGTDITALAANQGSTSMTVSSPIAPDNATPDSNGLIGPWRLEATYVPDATAPTVTAVAASPALFTTAVGSVYVGGITPNPVHDSDTVTLTGPDIGICTTAVCTVGGNAMTAPLTRVDQNTATFVFPTFGYQLTASGTVAVTYTLNGYVLTSAVFDITWDPANGGIADGGGGYTPPPVVEIPTGDMGYPQQITRWVFNNPYTGETYTVPRNPSDMTSPFPARNITAKFTTAINGQVVLIEGAPTPANWTFSGTVADAAHFEALRRWANDNRTRIQITDHFGRVIDCVLLSFAPKPKRDVHRYWSHTYDVTALVLDVGAPTEVPSS